MKIKVLILFLIFAVFSVKALKIGDNFKNNPTLILAAGKSKNMQEIIFYMRSLILLDNNNF